jgi:Domain of unknown function (DUF4395)
MPPSSHLNFVRQQGFRDATAAGCGTQYPALMFQPRLIGILVLIGLALQAPDVFLILSAVLWWNVFAPALNPFDALHNVLIAQINNLPRVAPAPGPRRFAQGMAGSFMLGIGLSLLWGWSTAAWVLEILLVIALGALIFGKFCLGSYLFHLLHGETEFANSTLPWARGR